MTVTIRSELDDLAAVVPDEVVARIRGARAILAVAHENPDADTLGATLGVTFLAEAFGARVTPVCADVPPAAYAAMPGIERFRSDPEPGVAYDLLVISDAGPLERTGAVLERNRDLMIGLPRVTIDHHLSSDGTGPADWIDPAAAATCEMVALLAARLGVPLDAGEGALAANLMAGLVTDTATFAHPNTTPRTLRVAAALMDAGAPLSELSNRFYRTKPVPQLRLLGRALARLDGTPDGRVVWTTLVDDDLAATGATPAHSDGLIDLLSQADTAEVALVFKAVGPTTRVSVRTKPGGVDATVLTAAFGGGGHARAAGASIPHPLEAAVPLVVADAERLASLVRR
jgi:phosphoesterase RecJ-like protein